MSEVECAESWLKKSACLGCNESGGEGETRGRSKATVDNAPPFVASTALDINQDRTNAVRLAVVRNIYVPIGFQSARYRRR